MVINRILQALVLATGLLFLGLGLRWLIAPMPAAEMLGIALGDGLALSSQIGDMSAFFLTAGGCALAALITGNRAFYFPTMALMLLTAIGRVVAWVVYDAALATDLIATEVIVTVLLGVAAARLAPKNS